MVAPPTHVCVRSSHVPLHCDSRLDRLDGDKRATASALDILLRERAGPSPEVPEAPPDDAESGDRGYREKHPGGTSDLAPGQNADDHQARVKLDPASHDEGLFT